MVLMYLQYLIVAMLIGATQVTTTGSLSTIVGDETDRTHCAVDDEPQQRLPWRSDGNRTLRVLSTETTRRRQVKVHKRRTLSGRPVHDWRGPTLDCPVCRGLASARARAPSVACAARRTRVIYRRSKYLSLCLRHLRIAARVCP